MSISGLPQIDGLFNLPIELRPLLDEIPLGIVVLDANRRIIYLNRALEVLTGFSNEEALGIPCYHILRSKICVSRCPALDMQAESGSVCVESDLIKRDRQLIPVRITSAPLKDLAENSVGFLETIEK